MLSTILILDFAILFILLLNVDYSINISFQYIHNQKTGEPTNFFFSILIYALVGIIPGALLFSVNCLIGMIINEIIHRNDVKTIYHHYSHYGRGYYKTSKSMDEDSDFMVKASQYSAYILTYVVLFLIAINIVIF